jgi:hypothetical protein
MKERETHRERERERERERNRKKDGCPRERKGVRETEIKR